MLNEQVHLSCLSSPHSLEDIPHILHILCVPGVLADATEITILRSCTGGPAGAAVRQENKSTRSSMRTALLAALMVVALVHY